MASPAVTYTFTNSTVADADEVNTNFADIINSLTDGTKDLSISALTAAGSATFNGNITLGNASSDDITVTGSLASSIPIKTTNSYDIGSSTLGLAGIYFGNAGGSTTIRVVSSSSVSSSATYTIPDVGASGTFVLEDSNGDVAINTNGFYYDSSGSNIGVNQTPDSDAVMDVACTDSTNKFRILNTTSQTGTTSKEILNLLFCGQEASQEHNIASIKAVQDANWSTSTANLAPTSLQFYTQDNSSTDQTDFSTGTERMVIDSNGDVGIGSGNDEPSARLHVYEESPGGASSDMVYIQKNDTVSDTQFIRFLQNTLASPLQRGGIKRDGSNTIPTFYSGSDKRIKENFGDMPDMLERVCSIELKTFDYKNDDANGCGPIAQQLYDIFPEKVTKTDDGDGEKLPEGVEPWSVSHSWNYELIKCIQELSAKVDDLEKRLAQK